MLALIEAFAEIMKVPPADTAPILAKARVAMTAPPKPLATITPEIEV